MKYKAIIFDCDGTLLNTLTDLTQAVNYALRVLELPMVSEYETVNMVGNGIKALITRALPGEKKYLAEKALDLFKEYYDEHFSDYTQPYNGILELLNKLKKNGYKLALVSNKNYKYLNKLFDKYFIDYIDYKIGETNGLLPKPAPDMINIALENLCVNKKEAVYVGDSSVDVQTTKNANIDGIFCSWGYNSVQKLKENGAKIIINAPSDLLNLV